MKDLSKYIGRHFVYGVTDCYTLFRDFYREEFNIDLPNFARYDGWQNDGLNLYADNMPKHGFYLVPQGEPLMYGDVILVCLCSPVPCHSAIYIGENKILHHVQDHLSCISPYRGVFKNCTASIWRHESRKNLKIERKTYGVREENPQEATVTL